VSSLALSEDGKFLVSGSYDFTVILWDLTTKSKTLVGSHYDLVTSVAFLSETNEIISASWDKTVKRWEFKQEEVTQLG